MSFFPDEQWQHLFTAQRWSNSRFGLDNVDGIGSHIIISDG